MLKSVKSFCFKQYFGGKLLFLDKSLGRLNDKIVATTLYPPQAKRGSTSEA